MKFQLDESANRRPWTAGRAVSGCLMNVVGENEQLDCASSRCGLSKPNFVFDLVLFLFGS